VSLETGGSPESDSAIQAAINPRAKFRSHQIIHAQMFDRDEMPIGAVAKSGYEVLLEAAEPDEGIPRDDAHAKLLEAGLQMRTPNTPLIDC